ncbi:Bet5-like protein [Giardia lamblia P15]|uniref:Trafficking protein particle complex subunit n=1 Tax=Giardia intestinalis (strain P15) TaxID=658858 RepID=E1EXZ9_GIAIA|nr:Bet5-like protein [Giardia lamblia P15]
MPPLQFYVYRRSGALLYFRAFECTDDAPMDMLAGLLFTLRRSSIALTPGEDARLESFKTDTYTCHIYETASGYWFVFLTRPESKPLNNELQAIYRDIFVPTVVKNLEWTPATSFQNNEAFTHALDLVVKNMPD